MNVLVRLPAFSADVQLQRLMSDPKFHLDYRWLQVPVLDDRGVLRHAAAAQVDLQPMA